MAKSDFIQAPRDITTRYRPLDQVKHKLVQTKANVYLWQSTLNRDALSLPQQVKYHVTEGPSAFALMMEQESALEIFKSSIARQANREHYFQVVFDTTDSDGRKFLGVPLSRKLAGLGTMRRVYRRLLRTNQNVYCMEYRSF